MQYYDERGHPVDRDLVVHDVTGRPPTDGPMSVTRIVVLSVGGLVAGVALLLGLVVGFGSAHQAYSRHQRVANAANHVKVVEQQIRQQEQQTIIVEKQAEQRYQEAIGIKRAQDEINSTLTPLYVQHEAIQAQEAIAESGRNNTIIYVPAGTNGVPVQITDPAAIAGQDKAPG